jgi:hypothetical protein
MGGDGDLLGRMVAWDSPLFGLWGTTMQEGPSTWSAGAPSIDRG